MQILQLLGIVIMITSNVSTGYTLSTYIKANIINSVGQLFYSSSHIYLLPACNSTHGEDLSSMYDIQMLSIYHSLKFASSMEMHLSQLITYSASMSEESANLYIIMSSYNATQQCLKQLSQHKSLGNRKWLIFLDSQSLEEFFRDIYIPIHCELLVAHTVSGDTDDNFQILLSEVYKLDPLGSLNVNRVTKWRSDSGFEWSTISYVQRRVNLQQMIIKSTFVESVGIIQFKPKFGVNFTAIEGYEAEIVCELARRLNFRIEFIPPEDGMYGIHHNNGTWSGMVGQVLRHEVAIGVGRFDFTSHRMQVVEYLPPIHEGKTMLFIKEPDMRDSNSKHILSPFAHEIWWMLLTTVFTMAAVWYVQGYFSDNLRIDHNISSSVFYMATIFCLQGHQKSPRTWSCRLVYLVAYVTALVIYIAYSAVFISSLNVRRLDLPFTDFKTLLQDGSYKIGLLPGSSTENFFKYSTSNVLRQVYSSMIRPHMQIFRDSPEQCVRNLCSSSRTGYITALNLVRSLQRSLSCNVISIENDYFPVTTSVIISKLSPYRRLFVHYILRMRETGILKRIFNRLYPSEVKEDLVQLPNVSLHTVKVFIVTLEIGFFISVSILLFEIVLSALRKCINRRQYEGLTLRK